MQNLSEYPALSRCSRYPEQATDIVADYNEDRFNQTVYVSRADVERVRALGLRQVPTRNKAGRRLQALWDECKTTRSADAFAKKHGWPFTIHVNNLTAL